MSPPTVSSNDGTPIRDGVVMDGPLGVRTLVGGTLAVGLFALWVLFRFLRWHYLLRRFDWRAPARWGLVRYAISVIGLMTPAAIGELVLRGLLAARRPGVGWRAILIGWLLERLLDAGALVLIVSLLTGAWQGLAVVLGLSLAFGLGIHTWVRARTIDRFPTAAAQFRTPVPIAVALAGSVLVWIPAIAGLWVVSLVTGAHVPVWSGVVAASTGFTSAILALQPVFALGGANVLSILATSGVGAAEALAITGQLQLAFIGAMLGIATLGGVVLLRSTRRLQSANAATHFDAIADEYLDQFSGYVWDLLLRRRVGHLVRAVPAQADTAPLGLDLGCGLGRQRQAMRERGFRVLGVDPAFGLLRQGGTGDGGVAAGSALTLPFRNAAFDFVYTVGVLHHVGNPRAQARAMAEIRRVLRPGGRLIVQESNTRNPLFRFYMGYIFPLLRSIDDGTEWWIAPHRWHGFEGFAVAQTTYFTFLPDFIPRALLPPLLQVEAWLERSVFKAYSVHYQVVLVAMFPAVGETAGADGLDVCRGGEGIPVQTQGGPC